MVRLWNSGPVTNAPDARLTGRFSYDVTSDKWSWDDDVYAIHGLEPGEVAPTTDLIITYKHEDDRERVRETLDRAMADGAPFNIYYRLVHRDGQERRIVLAGEGERGADGQVAELFGYYVDLTPDFDEDAADVARAAIAASAEHRAWIEQAKGALMLSYGLDADAAFAMLRWWSRNRNMKVRDVAERLLEVVQSGDVSHQSLRRVVDVLLDDLTVDPDEEIKGSLQAGMESVGEGVE